MRFAQRVFLVAGVYGIVVLLPQFLMEGRIGRDYPPPITHPENFYGFLGVGLAWQVLFLIISRDPVRYRLAMLPGALEKLLFACAVLVLCLQGRVSGPVVGFALIDSVLGVLFLVAFRRTATLDSGHP